MIKIEFEEVIKREFYFMVSESVTTFERDPGKNEPFFHDEAFRGPDLIECARNATRHYWERLEGMSSRKYFLQFAAPSDFILGKNAAFSITMIFVVVEVTSKGQREQLYSLLGEERSETAEGWEVFRYWKKELGYE